MHIHNKYVGLLYRSIYALYMLYIINGPTLAIYSLTQHT